MAIEKTHPFGRELVEVRRDRARPSRAAPPPRVGARARGISVRYRLEEYVDGLLSPDEEREIERTLEDLDA